MLQTGYSTLAFQLYTDDMRTITGPLAARAHPIVRFDLGRMELGLAYVLQGFNELAEIISRIEATDAVEPGTSFRLIDCALTRLRLAVDSKG
jgi:hypothetical protein